MEFPFKFKRSEWRQKDWHCRPFTAQSESCLPMDTGVSTEASWTLLRCQHWWEADTSRRKPYHQWKCKWAFLLEKAFSSSCVFVHTHKKILPSLGIYFCSCSLTQFSFHFSAVWVQNGDREEKWSKKHHQDFMALLFFFFSFFPLSCFPSNVFTVILPTVFRPHTLFFSPNV